MRKTDPNIKISFPHCSIIKNKLISSHLFKLQIAIRSHYLNYFRNKIHDSGLL